MIRTHKESIVYPQNAANSPQSINLLDDFSLENSIIVDMNMIIRGNQVATGGGAVSGFHRDAPCGMITTAKFEGGYSGGVAKAKRVIFDCPPQQMYWPGNYMASVINALLRTSSGASQTDPIRAVIPVPLRDPHYRKSEAVYIDCRDYTSLKLDVRWGPDADLATTNLSDVTSLELEVELEVADDYIPRKTPHYEPNIVYKEMPADTSSSRLVTEGDITWDGDLCSLWLQQHDDNASGDSERVDGLVRALTLQHGKGQAIPFTRWDPLRRDTWKRYPYTQSTTEIAGIASALFRVPRRSEQGKLLVIRNTQETNPPGVAAITPAANDKLFTLAIAAERVYGAM